MESMGIPNSPSGLELTIATPGSRNGLHISSSSVSAGNTGSNVENKRELALLDTLNLPVSGDGEDVDVPIISNMETESEENRRPVGGSSFQRRKYNRFSEEQSDMLEASFQQNHSPDKGTKQALADTLKVTLKQVQVWFVNRRSRMKKDKMEQNKKELEGYKRQVESLTNETQHLRRKVNKLKKKLKKLKLKQAPSLTQTTPLAAAATTIEQQQQKQVMYVPVLAGLFSNSEQNVATTSAATTASFITQQGSVSATPGLPVTNALVLPSSGGSNI